MWCKVWIEICILDIYVNDHAGLLLLGVSLMNTRGEIDAEGSPSQVWSGNTTFSLILSKFEDTYLSPSRSANRISFLYFIKKVMVRCLKTCVVSDTTIFYFYCNLKFRTFLDIPGHSWSYISERSWFDKQHSVSSFLLYSFFYIKNWLLK